MAETSQRPVAIIVGVGAGLGAALARRFASGYRDDLKNVPGISELTVERLGERRLSVSKE